MRAKQRLPPGQKHTDPAERPGPSHRNTCSPAMKGKKKDDLPAKMTVKPSLSGKSKKTNPIHREKASQTFPTKAKPPQPSCRRADLRQRGFTCSETNQPRKTIKLNWLWKLPQWRHSRRTLKVTSSKPPRPRPQATTAKMKQQIPGQGEESVMGSTHSLSRSVRSLQLCTSSSESSPSPPVTPGRGRRATRLYRTRRFLKQLWWYQALHNERKRVQRLNQQCSKMTQSSSDSSVVKGTSEYLDNLGLTYQREKRKRSSPPGQGLPATKKSSRKTIRRSWGRQLDSSSSDSPVSECSANVTPVFAGCVPSSSPGTQSCLDTFTSPQASSSTKIKSAKTKIPAVTPQCGNDSWLHLPDQALPKQLNRKRVTFSAIKDQDKSKAANSTLADKNCLDISTNLATFSPTQKTMKSPKTLKMVQFKDSPHPGDLLRASATQISDEASRSESAASPTSRLKLPSTPHICKKKSARHHRSSAPTKLKVKAQTCSDLEVNLRRQLDKSDLKSKASLQTASEMVPSPKSVLRETWSPKDPRQRKNGIRHVRQTTSNNPSQTETRLQDHPQAQFKTASAKRSEKPPSSKAALSTFRRPGCASQETLKTANLTTGDNFTQRTQTPFRKPDTPRPKSCPEFLKWKKVLQQRSESTRRAARCVSNCQGQSSQKNEELPSLVFGNVAEHSSEQSFNLCNCSTPISKFTQKHIHANRPSSGCGNSANVEQSHTAEGEITERQRSTADSLTQSSPASDNGQAAAQNEMVEQQQLRTPQTVQELSSSFSPGPSQAIVGAMRFFWGVQLVDTESASISTTYHPVPSPDSSAFNSDGRRSQCWYYVLRPEPTQGPHSQDTSLFIQPSPFRPAQGGGGDNHAWPSRQQAHSERENRGRATLPSRVRASASDRTRSSTP